MERFFARLFYRSKILSLIELGRPWNSLAPSIAGLIGIFLISSYTVPIVPLFLIFITFFSCFSGGTVLNDIIDEKIDKINMPFRPLESKRVTKKEASIYMIILYITSLLISSLLSFRLFLIVVIFVITSIFYSLPPISLQKRGFLAQLTLSFVSFFLPAYGGAVFLMNDFNIPVNLLLSLISFFMFYSFLIIGKDFKDKKGDSIMGKKTFVLRVGAKKAKYIMIIGLLVTFPITIFYLNTMINNLAFIILSLFSLFPILYYSFNIEKKPEASFQNLRITILYLLLIIIIFSVIS